MEPLQKEKRTGVACEECRKRKKCDGFLPACTWCTASQKDGLRKEFDAEYLSVLEEQVSTLRAQVEDLKRTQNVLPPESEVPPSMTTNASDVSPLKLPFK
ncbi:hypothetical protein BDZ45DRAFT_743125 [Acephala macrosclerotiorum]|nr:hypothetical protein BDZ45DRAFT_743125 [Acephala macrosclerotiorum]